MTTEAIAKELYEALRRYVNDENIEGHFQSTYNKRAQMALAAYEASITIDLEK